MGKKLLLLLGSNAGGAALLFARNLIVARLIGVEDYGIASTFAIALAIVEMTSQFGLHQMIIQDPNGDDPRLQTGLQGFHLLRAVVTTLFLLVLAHPFARIMGIDHVAWAFQLLALSRLAYGFQHFDIYRLQRHGIYFPLAVVTGLVPLLALLLIFPLAWIFSDWRIMLYSILAQSFFHSLISHLLSNRSYRLSLHRDIIKRGIKFGWPILLNGGLLFLVYHGEKIIVGREIGMSVLGVFAMGITLTQAPMQILTRTTQAIFLPQLSHTQDTPNRFHPTAYAAIEAGTVMGLIGITATIFVVLPLVPIVLGNEYSAMITILPMLAVLQAVRTFKGTIGMVSLAKAKTGNALVANLPRALAIPASWYMVTLGYGVDAIISIAIFSELCGVVISAALLRSQIRMSLRPLLPGVTAMLALLGVLFWISRGGPVSEVALQTQVFFALLTFVVLGAQTRFWFYLPTLRHA